mmetsp:Transcript_17824/g.25807  ORF Transcript_17824/g.25807 Transcript_17824/m.25807 type:complete len:165 (-) Transcript_17824:115-609(-)
MQYCEMDQPQKRTDTVHRVEDEHGRGNGTVSWDNPPKHASNNWTKTSQAEDELFSRPVSPGQRNTIQIEQNESRRVSADSSPPSEDDQTEEQMQDSDDTDMIMIKKLKDTLKKLKRINDDLKNENTDLNDEVTDLKVEMEILIADREESSDSLDSSDSSDSSNS